MQEFEKGTVNMTRSVSVYYSGGIMGKKKYRSTYKDLSYFNESSVRKRLTVLDCPIPNLVPYHKLMRFIKNIDIGSLTSVKETLCDGLPESEKYDGVYRDMKELLLTLAMFYLNQQEYFEIKWFEGKTNTFYVTLGGDGAPFGKEDTAFAWLVSFLNIGKKVLSSNENYLLFGANCPENAIVVSRYIKKLMLDINNIEKTTFTVTLNNDESVGIRFLFSELPNDMKMLAFLAGELPNSARYFSSFADVNKENMKSLNGRFGRSEASTWKPWQYSDRLKVVTKIEAFKKGLNKSKLAESTKRTKVTTHISELKSRQEFVPLVGKLIDTAHIEPLHLKNNACAHIHRILLNKVVLLSNINKSLPFSQVPKNSPIAKYVQAMRTQCQLKRLSKRVVRWFDEACASGKEFDYRFTVPQYDVIKLLPHRTQRSAHEGDDKIMYKIPAFGEELLLDMKKATNSLNPPAIVVQQRTIDGKLLKEDYKPKGTMLHGVVVSDPSSRVALRETGDKRELSGAIFSGDYVYKLEPINDNLKQRASLYGEGHHVVTKRTINQRSVEKMKPIKVQGASTPNFLRRKKRSVEQTPLKPKIVELMITVDKPTYEFYRNETMSYVLNVANMVNRLYQDVSMGFDISVVLTKVFIIQGFEPGLDYQANNVTSAVKYLYTFASWGSKQAARFPTAAPGHYDNGVLLSRRICGINSCRLDGLAFSGYPCNLNLGFSVNHATGLQVAFSVAHEMGHNLGMGHDHGSCHQGFIMSAGQPNGPNAFKWSPCSARELRDVMSRVKCYDNRPATVTTATLKYPPGYLFDKDKQCKMAFGPSYSFCPVTKGNCGLLFCLKGSGCVSHSAPPLDGTPCGNRKWCKRGECVHVGDDLPPSVDGQWSGWKGFTPCSRSCGGGVRFRRRYCNNPSPQYFGKTCFGSDKGHEELCNTQECSTPGNPRNEQCQKEGLSSSYYHSPSPCMLYCVHGSYAKGHGDVVDGIRCYQSGDKKDVCITGKCRRVGCDNILESENPNDRCQICGGDGSSCTPVTLPNYSRQFVVDPGKPLSPTPYLMFTIPVGAVNVTIKELGKTSNVLTLKLDLDPSSPYVVPVPSYTGTYNAAGTVIKHFMPGFYEEEWIHIRGPTTKTLYAMFIYIARENNPGVSCHYIMPGQGKSTTYVWKVKRGTTCSADCAGGEKYHIVTCHRQDDGTGVGTRFCDQSAKPPAREPCNTQPCAPQWSSGDWMICSKSCAGGQQTRSVKCHQKVTQNTFKTLPSSSCAQPQPISVQPCNTHECPPYWNRSPWSKCSAECEGGTRSRTVKCEQTLLNSSTIALNDEKCMTELGMKPREVEPCNTMDCHVWDVKYPCEKCTATKGYYHLGCYGDKGDRALPKLLSAHLQGDKVANCYNLANSQGYKMFAVQNSGECWTSITANDTYNKYGASDACQNNQGGPWANDVYEIVQEREYSSIGCFKDKGIEPKRPLPKFVSNLRDEIDWKHISKTVMECSDDAWAADFPVFGVQYYGECWSGPLGHKSYDIDGPSSGCWEGVGADSANFVYAFSRRVTRPIITCRHVVTTVKVPDGQCRAEKPKEEMRLCKEVCKTEQ